MSKMEMKKTTWTASPTRKKVIVLILSNKGCCQSHPESAEIESGEEGGKNKEQRGDLKKEI